MCMVNACPIICCEFPFKKYICATYIHSSLKVWKDLNDAEYRRHLYMRERSYASEPGSRIQLKLDAEKEINELDELDQDRDDRDDDDDDTIECDIGIRTSTLSEPLDFGRRSQTLLEIQSPPPEQFPCPDPDPDPVVSVQQTQNKKQTK
ncbi:uncharacterized protein LOC132798695 [Drosophila nasuta]|uniref:uncharacterized protein LOC132798695 n=1 Tax=Drosophila nasuta TaxID=42062 RepID=UPI00295EB521|nr:uncharacterized protein LOC132798695 [Drosophila nasuta]